ncbi:hypothetical protein [Desulfurivibrio alkaliphilus]|uniref:Uncharacterized protein n=1 Tax=Desulfurivibrio alkaliphilus (strain DSM 19089 / UNIQEM U267 / AHT2) TaxID=589865 RepID=D6Z5Y4_DESAT|nr:hypothetical protein [Desulfurivibrio alkaliphilus]ADH84866.1 hypothetical protein DaAHT2_0155 [Desulfurivibrio alkaliphilus AHT 2]
MSNHKLSRESSQKLSLDWSHEARCEFSAFVEARPIMPRPATEAAIFRLVRERSLFNLQAFSARFLPVQAVSGLATLAVCPQFGIGGHWGGRLEALLHVSANPWLFYATCGLFFVLFGALLSGLLIGLRPRGAGGLGAYSLFAVYSLVAYLLLSLLGGEAFVLVSLAWLVGALAGNILGFELGGRLRRTLGRFRPALGSA